MRIHSSGLFSRMFGFRAPSSTRGNDGSSASAADGATSAETPKRSWRLDVFVQGAFLAIVDGVRSVQGPFLAIVDGVRSARHAWTSSAKRANQRIDAIVNLSHWCR